MILHIIYYETSLKYPDSQFPLKMVSIALFNASIHPLALEKNPVFSIEELKYLLEFQQTAIALDNLKKYEKILSRWGISEGLVDQAMINERPVND